MQAAHPGVRGAGSVRLGAAGAQAPPWSHRDAGLCPGRALPGGGDPSPRSSQGPESTRREIPGVERRRTPRALSALQGRRSAAPSARQVTPRWAGIQVPLKPVHQRSSVNQGQVPIRGPCEESIPPGKAVFCARIRWARSFCSSGKRK